MAIYLRENLSDLLRDKRILFLGDSVQRSVYKDLVVLCHDNRFISQSELRKKGEDSFMGDKLIHRSELTNGTHYREVREFKNNDFHFRFHFITRVYNDYVESILEDLTTGKEPMPDVLVLSSCLWDISRYGRDSINTYRENLVKLCRRLETLLPPSSLIIWRTALPVREDMKGGFLTADAEWCRNLLRLDILRANYYAYNIVHRFNYDILDMHYHFRYQLHRQAGDGVHWNMYAHRRMTNILLSHIAESWNREIPKLPWEDDSKIDFAADEIEMNTTNVLKQAYEPKNVKLEPIFFQNLNQYQPDFQTPQKLYTSFYNLPHEETEYDCNNNYEILPQEPMFLHKHELPTNPYPDYDNVSSSQENRAVLGSSLQVTFAQQPTNNKMRHRRKNERKHLYRRPGQVSEMLKRRLQRERAQERVVHVEHQSQFFNRVQRPSVGTCTSKQPGWSYYSRYHPAYHQPTYYH